MNNEDKAYLAGFLDGDGSILVQIIPRKDYKFGFQIRFSIVFYQKTIRHWFLIQISKQLKYGSLRKKKDGMSEYAIVGIDVVEKVLKQLYPFLRIKKPLARLTLSIIQNLRKVENITEFIEICELVDKTASYNYSKKRTITSDTVRESTKNNPRRD